MDIDAAVQVLGPAIAVGIPLVIAGWRYSLRFDRLERKADTTLELLSTHTHNGGVRAPILKDGD